MKAMIIVFAGTVGVGKSTHTKLAWEHIQRMGVKKCIFLQISAFSGLGSGLYRYICKKILRHLENNALWVAFKVKVLLLLDVVSISSYILPLLLILEKFLDYTLIIEDYFQTILMDYLHVTSNWYRRKYLSDKLSFNKSILTRISILMCIKLLRKFPPDILFMLDADDLELDKRLKNRNSFNEHPSYIKFRRETLMKLCMLTKARTIVYVNSSNKTIKHTHYEIVKALGSIKNG
ncbi:MAG: hypothetical protein QXR45_09325 [Candidatus Bathyarchaeia archaeon]